MDDGFEGDVGSWYGSELRARLGRAGQPARPTSDRAPGSRPAAAPPPHAGAPLRGGGGGGLGKRRAQDAPPAAPPPPAAHRRCG
jgi:hypothetical protein